MVVKEGEKVHVVIRRCFDGDIRRHFAGVVREAGESVIRVEGYASIFDPATRRFVRRPGLRTQIISLVDAGNTVSILPPGVEVDKLSYCAKEPDHLELTDGKSFQLDVSELKPKSKGSR